MRVSNLILDFGGVIIDVDYGRVVQVFRQLGIADFDRLYSRQRQSRLFDAFEKGLISETEFRATLRRYLPPAISDEEIDRAWNSMIGTIPQKRMDFLKELARHYRLYLLSNTNIIHTRTITQRLNRQYGENAFERLFQRIYYSFQIGLRKPEEAIYGRVMQENQLSYQDTLFIDDSEQHVEGARQAGLRALHLDVSHTTLEEWLPSQLSLLSFR
jgi:putative hydrolase of the HAD superfamily